MARFTADDVIGMLSDDDGDLDASGSDIGIDVGDHDTSDNEVSLFSFCDNTVLPKKNVP